MNSLRWKFVPLSSYRGVFIIAPQSLNLGHSLKSFEIIIDTRHSDRSMGCPNNPKGNLGNTSQTFFLGMARPDGVQTRLSGILISQSHPDSLQTRSQMRLSGKLDSNVWTALLPIQTVLAWIESWHFWSPFCLPNYTNKNLQYSIIMKFLSCLKKFFILIELNPSYFMWYINDCYTTVLIDMLSIGLDEPCLGKANLSTP
jgi:hypothetical protein